MKRFTVLLRLRAPGSLNNFDPTITTVWGIDVEHALACATAKAQALEWECSPGATCWEVIMPLPA
jgi:hypothetical protein